MHVCDMCDMIDARLFVISGKRLIEAKNTATDGALDLEEDLLIVEDDVIADFSIWEAVRDDTPDVLYADTVERWGRINVRYNKKGDLLWTGNVFTRVPFSVLSRLERPIFRSWNFVMAADGSQLIDRGEANHGNHSDAFFWWSLQKLDPPPVIRNIGRVDHIKTPFNTGDATNHNNPFKCIPFELKDMESAVER